MQTVAHAKTNSYKPRVLHLLTNSFPHTQSGYSIRSHEVLKCQSDFARVRAVTRLGYPIIIGKIIGARKDVIDGIEYTRLIPFRMPRLKSQRLVKQALEVSKQIEDFKPNVLHTTTNYENAIVVDALSQAHKIPWIYEMRGELEKTWVARQKPGAQPAAQASDYYRALRARELFFAQRANHVITLSKWQKTSLVERGVNESKITVVPNAIDESMLAKPYRSPMKARNMVGLPKEGYWVGSVSSLVDYEGFDVLLSAVANLRKHGHDVRCLLVGDGVVREALIEQARQLTIQDYVAFPGKISYEDVYSWYQALDCFVVPRKNTEVCKSVTPIKPFTAMALRRPVIASDLPALREVCSDGRTGLLCEPENVNELSKAILMMSRQESLCSSLCDSAYNYVTNYTWSYNGERYERIVKKLLRKEA
ncbi:MAG: glycosyltransferase family 4 protein [Vagococcus sp.]|nr:glycosyltransferase family 4 protein [Vagococcus sp.]